MAAGRDGRVEGGGAGRTDAAAERAQLDQLDRALRRGPRAHGFATDLWTLDRVATVIEAETGVRYHRGHVWKLLRDKLGWSRQRPARRAIERDDEAIARWVAEEWPRIKGGARRRRAWIVFQDESGVSLLPPVRATWAPRGRTPVLRHRFGWKRLSMSAAVAYASDRGDARIVFQTHAGAYNDESLIEFLDALHDELGGTKVTLIWDGLPSHRSRKMQAYIRAQRRWLVVERLPGYAPDLNPVEALWGNIKGTRAGQPVRRQHRRARPRRPSRHRPRSSRHRSRLRLLAPQRPFSMTNLSL